MSNIVELTNLLRELYIHNKGVLSYADFILASEEYHIEPEDLKRHLIEIMNDLPAKKNVVLPFKEINRFLLLQKAIESKSNNPVYQAVAKEMDMLKENYRKATPNTDEIKEAIQTIREKTAPFAEKVPKLVNAFNEYASLCEKYYTHAAALKRLRINIRLEPLAKNAIELVEKNKENLTSEVYLDIAKELYTTNQPLFKDNLYCFSIIRAFLDEAISSVHLEIPQIDLPEGLIIKEPEEIVKEPEEITVDTEEITIDTEETEETLPLPVQETISEEKEETLTPSPKEQDEEDKPLEEGPAEVEEVIEVEKTTEEEETPHVENSEEENIGSASNEESEKPEEISFEPESEEPETKDEIEPEETIEKEVTASKEEEATVEEPIRQPESFQKPVEVEKPVAQEKKSGKSKLIIISSILIIASAAGAGIVWFSTKDIPQPVREVQTIPSITENPEEDAVNKDTIVANEPITESPQVETQTPQPTKPVQEKPQAEQPARQATPTATPVTKQPETKQAPTIPDTPETSSGNTVFDTLLKKAKAGDANSQFKVGQCYEKGNGVNADMFEALTWYRKAKVNGSKEAELRLIELGY